MASEVSACVSHRFSDTPCEQCGKRMNYWHCHSGGEDVDTEKTCFECFRPQVAHLEPSVTIEKYWTTFLYTEPKGTSQYMSVY